MRPVAFLLGDEPVEVDTRGRAPPHVVHPVPRHRITPGAADLVERSADQSPAGVVDDQLHVP